MLKTTKHAIDRLEQRYGIIGENDLLNITGHLSVNEHYKLISHSNGGEIREVTFRKKKIQAYIKDGSIISFIPPRHVQTEDMSTIQLQLLKVDKVKQDILNNKKENKRLQKKLDSMLKTSFIKGFISFLYYRSKGENNA